MKPLATDFKQWHVDWSNRYAVYEASPQQAPVTDVMRMMEEAIVPSKQWEDAVLRYYYHLHLLLFGLHKTDIASQRFVYHQDWSATAEQLGREFKEQVRFGEENGMTLKALKAKEADHYDAIACGLSEMILDYMSRTSSSRTDWLGLFRTLWSRLLVADSARRKEQERIEAMESDTRLPIFLRQQAMLACTHLEWLLLGDQAAIEMLDRKLAIVKPVWVMDYLHWHRQRGSREDFLLWLKWLVRRAGSWREQQIRDVFDIWQAWCGTEEERTDWLAAALEALPATLRYLSEYFIENEQYEQWAGLFLITGKEPEYVHPEGLLIVSQHRADVLIPLSVQRVHRLIAEKKRESYAEAVRHLKKLRVWFEKWDREPEWKRYFERMIHEHARLRAFQEELRREKLIP